jgi:hypothetical protein
MRTIALRDGFNIWTREINVTARADLAISFLHQCTARLPPSHGIELFVWFVLDLRVTR